MAAETDRQIINLLMQMNGTLIQMKLLMEGLKDEGLHVRTQESQV